MKNKLLLSVFLTLSIVSSLYSQWSLGDIAFTGYQSDNSGNPSGEEDQFSFVLLRDIAIGEKISFTENGWLAAGGFLSGENTVTLEFTTALPKGSQVSISRIPFVAINEMGVNVGNLTGDGLSLSVSGDQIFAYDTDNVPNSNTNQAGFIAAIQMNGDWDLEATSTTTSSKPTIFDNLPSSTIAITSEVDNGIYNCSVTTLDDIENLRSAIHNQVNWDVNNDNPFNQPANCNFSTTLSTQLPNENNMIKIYPNPSIDYIYIENINSEYSYIIYNILGEEINKGQVFSDNKIDVKKLKDGFYLLIIESKSNDVSKFKFLKRG